MLANSPETLSRLLNPWRTDVPAVSNVDRRPTAGDVSRANASVVLPSAASMFVATAVEAVNQQFWRCVYLWFREGRHRLSRFSTCRLPSSAHQTVVIRVRVSSLATFTAPALSACVHSESPRREYEQNQCGNIHKLLGWLACGDQDLLDDLVEIEPRFWRDAV